MNESRSYPLYFEPKPAPYTEVNSDTFYYYLFSNLGLFSKHITFANQLDLGYFYPVFKHVYDSVEIMKTPDTDPITKFVLGDLEGTVEGELLKTTLDNIEISKQLVLPKERSATIFYDPSTNQNGFTDVNQGDFTTVDSPTAKVIKEGKRPIIEVHTHPINSLPSPPDYANMLTELEGIRAVRAIAVLNPNNQILALVTEQTPGIEPEIVQSKIPDMVSKTYYGLDPQEVKRLFDLKRRFSFIFNAEKKVKVNLVKNLAQIAESQGINSLDDPKLEAIVNDFIEIQRCISLGLRLENLRDNSGKKMYDKERKITELVNYLFAQQIKVQLYFSTNMRNFTKFTA